MPAAARALAVPPHPPVPPAPSWQALAHLPHCGLPPLWVDLALLRDTLGFVRGVARRAGPVSRAMLVGRPQALLLSADAVEAVLGDTAGRVSAAGGWAPFLGELFPGGLILRDGDDHRSHRRRMLPALRRDALERHLDRMAPRIAAEVAQWCNAGRLDVHEAVRRLTLHLASDVFLGIRADAEIEAAHHDFVRLVDASAAVLRWRVPATRYGRGLAARHRLAGFLAARIPERRAAPGDDLFSQLCVARDDDGLAFTDAEIVDHMIFLWMAAHDTTRSAVTTLLRALALAPAWQARLRDEARAAWPAGQPMTMAALAAMESLGWALKEALRLYPPIPSLARQLLAPMTIDGHALPAGTPVTLFPLAVHRDPRWWPDPDRFDPERFSPARAEPARHRSAWVPFGGGAHMCLGQHFAMMQGKALGAALLGAARWQLDGSPSAAGMAFAPIAHPPRGLWLRFERL
jgi:cytochrome P450